MRGTAGGATVWEDVGFGLGCCAKGIEGAHDDAVGAILKDEANAARGVGRKGGCRRHSGGERRRWGL